MSTASASPRRSAAKLRNVFIIEGDWWGSLEQHRSSTVKAIVDLVAQMHPQLKRIHRMAATREEFDHYLRLWSQARHAKYPILYLAFHGSPNHLHVGDGRLKSSRVTLDEIAELLRDKCKGRIVHCGSCDTINVDRRNLKRFLRTTGASAVCGYRGYTDWIEAAAFEVLLLNEMQGRSTNLNGVRSLERRLKQVAPKLGRELGFRFVTA